MTSSNESQLCAAFTLPTSTCTYVRHSHYPRQRASTYVIHITHVNVHLRTSFALPTSTCIYVRHSHYPRQRAPTYVRMSTSVAARCRHPSPNVDVRCWIDVKCENIHILLNVIQHHHVRHQKVGQRTGSCSTVACYFLL